MSAATDTGASGAPIEGVDELLLLRRLERFVTEELELLDGREFEAWRDLFTKDGTYWAPSQIDQESPDGEVSLFFDDLEIMDTRIQRLRHPRVHAQIPHSRTTHVVGNFVIDEADEASGEYAFRCRFVMHEYRPAMEQRAFSGQYAYRIKRHGQGFRISSKKVTVINCDAMHFPISTPF